MKVRFLFVLMMSLSLMGCQTPEQAQQKLEKTQDQLVEIRDYKRQVDSRIAGFQQIQAALEDLPPDVKSQFGSVFTILERGVEDASDLSNALESDLDVLENEVIPRLEEGYAQARNQWDVFLTSTEGILALLGASTGTGLIASIIGILRGRKRGEYEGAKKVADAFKVGPGNDVKTAMKFLDKHHPNVARALREADLDE